MKDLRDIPHIPSVCSERTAYRRYYGEWLKEFNWTYILTLRRHIPLTESACGKLSQNLLQHSDKVKTIWMALEQDRGDNGMNHLHVLIESGQLQFTRSQMVEALGITRHPKTLSYFSPVDSSEAVAMYCTKRIGYGRLRFHDFHFQSTKTYKTCH